MLSELELDMNILSEFEIIYPVQTTTYLNVSKCRLELELIKIIIICSAPFVRNVLLTCPSLNVCK